MAHLYKHRILSDDQHCFCKRPSCETQLILTLNDLAKGLNSKQQIDAVLLDFSKAFDRVPHQRLLLKLHFYGIRGQVLHWIRDFLTGRTQRVLVEGQSSTTSSVTSGVPQGTVLGPLLFLVFINDLPSMATSTTRMFADDCLMYRTIHDTSDAAALQADLDNLQQWEQDWLMDFNPSKCEVITISNKRNCIAFPYTIHNETLKKTDCAKYLGVNITSNLSWSTHVDKICKKANSTQAFLQRNIRSCPQKIKARCYTTLVRPLLEFSSAAWAPHHKSDINKLESVQRRAARFVMRDYHRTSSVSSMLRHAT